MIFKCKNMKHRYGALIIVLAKLGILIVLVAQHVCAHPHRINQKERNVVQFPDMLKQPERDGAQSDLDRLIQATFQNDEAFHFERKQQRDTSRYQESNSTNISFNSASTIAIRERSAGRERVQSDTKFVFPGEMDRVPTCKGSTYCEKIDSYPEDIVNQAIQRNESLKYLAGVDVMSDIMQRIDITDDSPLCVSTEQVIFPQSAENKDNEWKYIANQENFKQGIRIEKCSKEGSSCKIFGGLAEGYKTSCKQKYVYRQLASVQSDGKIVPDTFRFPSSCCCYVSFNGSSLTRIGTNIVEQRSQSTPTKTRRRK